MNTKEAVCLRDSPRQSEEMMDSFMYHVGKKWFTVWKRIILSLHMKKKKFQEFDMNPFSSLKKVAPYMVLTLKCQLKSSVVSYVRKPGPGCPSAGCTARSGCFIAWRTDRELLPHPDSVANKTFKQKELESHGFSVLICLLRHTSCLPTFAPSSEGMIRTSWVSVSVSVSCVMPLLCSAPCPCPF